MKGKILTSYGISGKECSASVELLNANSSAGGICWFHGEKEPKNFKVAYENRTTVLIHASGKKIIGVEHLSAAALAFPNCEFALYAPQGELPLLDGSAKLWKEELNSIAGHCAPANLNFYTPSQKEIEIKTGERSLKFVAGPELEIQYAINRFGQKFDASVKIKKAEDFEKIFLARTFIFEQELQTANLSENLKDCGVLLHSDGKNILRFENEPAYHKILDLLGDLALYSNALPCGKFMVFNGGHELHHTATGALIAGQGS
ncbi:MAG: UDP-3-O-acyl-N-acetylglucosamine deacetylase [Candidatus Fibromonas sp.]|nr:UDP-3-O-acyl-N-acetylglucosamine deacetylase [Candidatus Fibromonas sp.]